MEKTPLEKLQEQEHKKYSMMRQFSVFFTSPQSADEMKKGLDVLKELAQGFLRVIESQLNAFEEDILKEICEKLKEEKTILTDMITKIDKIEKDQLYSDETK